MHLHMATKLYDFWRQRFDTLDPLLLVIVLEWSKIVTSCYSYYYTIPLDSATKENWRKTKMWMT